MGGLPLSTDDVDLKVGAAEGAVEAAERRLPDYLPARMANEFVYCPRLFFYEWVDGVFRESVDTVEGKFQHQRVDAKTTNLPKPEEAAAKGKIHSCSVTLSSEKYRVITRIDLVEGSVEAGSSPAQAADVGAHGMCHGQTPSAPTGAATRVLVTPVDYKHGHPRETPEGLQLWPSDRTQLALQGLVLRENGYCCQQGIVYYAETHQRVRVIFDEALMEETEAIIAQAWALARSGEMPPPLEDSPRCAGCSLVGICLPDETNSLRAVASGKWAVDSSESRTVQLSLFPDVTLGFSRGNTALNSAIGSRDGDGATPRMGFNRQSTITDRQSRVRQLVAPRDDLRPLYLNAQGARVGKSGEILQVHEKDELKQEVRIGEICQVNLMGNIQLTTQAIQSLCELGKPVCYFSQGGWFYGITTGLNSKNIFLRKSQFRLAEEGWFQLALSRRLVAGKIRNQRTMLQRNHLEPNPQSLLALKQMIERAERAENAEELLGIEGNAARVYFGDFAGMIKTPKNGGADPAQFHFDFSGRNRRPPRDAVNAMLSLAYSLLSKDLTIACYAVGFDPYMGFYHQPRFGRPALALDLMEPFRPLVADSTVLTASNTRMVTPPDFVQAGPGVALTTAGRKRFFHAYELRMDALVTHPLFEYRVSYRRLLEIQARLLARFLEGEIGEYPVFVTR
jgi:CRISPR-associated protein Cas1